MATDILMPQMGESIAEGTIVRWIKRVGERVDRDEPLFEISTDKVDAEIPSPAAGILTDIRAQEGETVPVNSVVGIIEAEGAAVRAPAAVESAAPPPLPAPQPDGSPVTGAPVSPGGPAQSTAQARSGAVASAFAEDVVDRDESAEERLRRKSSPLVRKIAQEHRVDISRVPGTGAGGRVTKQDILSFLEHPSVGAPPVQAHAPAAGQTPATGAGLAGQTLPMSVMRRKIAEHMVLSKRTSAHVHTVFEVNYTRVEQIRQAKKAEYEASGGKLTYLSFIVKAAADALRAVPVMNASVDANNNVTYHGVVNIGIAVALDWGLIVPVIKRADQKDLLGISKDIADLAARARAKRLTPEDVANGTFTVTNPGGSGAQFGLPIINQPQVAILGVGTIEKRPVVIDDAIGIRLMGFLSLAFDHRVVDGAVGDQFMALMKHQLESWDPSQV